MTTQATAGLAQGRISSAVLMVVGMAAADVIFLAGVVVPHLAGNDPLASIWIGLPALVSVFALPFLAYGVALAGGRRLLQKGRSYPGRRADLARLALAVVGLVAYASPWGWQAIAGLMTALD